MILVLGGALGLGLLLALSPMLWPRGRRGDIKHRPGVMSTFRESVTLAGLWGVSIPTIIAVSLIVGLLCAAIVFAVVPVIALALVAAVLGTTVPALVVRWRARRQRASLRVVWPDVVDHLVSALRSGLSLPDSVSSLAASGPPGLREHFASFERDYQATAQFSGCVDRLKDRLADPVADRILETLRMSREVGGSDLPAVLRGLAVYLRQDLAIRGEVQARQSWVLNAARLGAVAPWIVLLLLASRPEAAAAYNSAGGITVILGGLIVTVFAYRVMVSLARLPEERRWFR